MPDGAVYPVPGDCNTIGCQIVLCTLGPETGDCDTMGYLMVLYNLNLVDVKPYDV